jgi:putative hydrolase
MKPLFDLHTHTISGGHAYSTLKENIEGAKERGLAVMGFSDHAPFMEDAPHPFYFANFKVIREYLLGVRILKGIEANILDFEGSTDVDDAMGKKLDYVIASLHPPCIVPGTAEENTRALVGAMRNPFVKIIGHPDDDRYPLDYEELVAAAKREEVALELNNSSFRPGCGRQNGRKNARILLNLCRIHNTPVIMGSDAHIWYDVGELSLCEELLDETDFPRELVLNYRMEGLEFVLKEGVPLPDCEKLLCASEK